jgi:hypothetical protein
MRIAFSISREFLRQVYMNVMGQDWYGNGRRTLDGLEFILKECDLFLEL